MLPAAAADKEFEFIPDTIDDDELPRLILIDGFNVMHHFKKMKLPNPAIPDERMCALILLPLVYRLIYCGFHVRVVLKCMPEDKQVSDMYILKQLEDSGLTLYSPEVALEEDDLLMLKLAKKHRALIISRDQFRNHKGFEDIADKYVIPYDKVATDFKYDRNAAVLLKKKLYFNYRIELHDSFSNFTVDRDHEDYEIVKKSMAEFRQADSRTCLNLDLLMQYVYTTFCYIFNCGLPPCVQDFIDDFDFPMDFATFCSMKVDYEIKQRRNPKTVQPGLEPRCGNEISEDELEDFEYIEGQPNY